MKKIILIAFACILFTTTESFAQINKGSWMLGGSLGFGSSKLGSVSTSNIYLNPNVGYFVAKNVPVGLDLSYTTGNNFSGIAIAPFVRGYLTMGKFFLLAHGRFAYVNSSSNGVNGDSFGTGGGAGLGFFLNDNVALEGLFDYFIPDLGHTDLNNMGFKIALQVYFPKD